MGGLHVCLLPPGALLLSCAVAAAGVCVATHFLIHSVACLVVAVSLVVCLVGGASLFREFVLECVCLVVLECSSWGGPEVFLGWSWRGRDLIVLGYSSWGAPEVFFGWSQGDPGLVVLGCSSW